MARYTEQVLITEISVDEYANISVQRTTRVYRGKELISTENHRHVVMRGDPIDEEDERVRAIAAALDGFEWVARPEPPSL